MDRDLDRIRNNQLLKDLEGDEIEAVLALGAFHHVNKDDMIIREGGVNRHVYLVIDGSCEVSLEHGPDHLVAVRLATQGRDGFFGEYSYIDRAMASASVRALQDSELFRIPFEKLDGLLSTNSRVGSVIYRNMLDIMVVRLRESVAELGVFNDDMTVDAEMMPTA